MKTVGERIRLERVKRGMTLENVSKGTGLSKSYLSLLERGLSQVTVTSLKKIARHMGIGVVKFFEENNAEGNHGGWDYSGFLEKENQPFQQFTYSRDVNVVRVGRRKGITFPGSKVIYEILTPNFKRQLEVLHMRICEGQTSGDTPIVDPPGEKFGFVLKGSIEVKLDHELYQLEEGDSICFPSDMAHSWRGIKGESIEVIWVFTPPCF